MWRWHVPLWLPLPPLPSLITPLSSPFNIQTISLRILRIISHFVVCAKHLLFCCEPKLTYSPTPYSLQAVVCKTYLLWVDRVIRARRRIKLPEAVKLVLECGFWREREDTSCILGVPGALWVLGSVEVTVPVERPWASPMASRIKEVCVFVNLSIMSCLCRICGCARRFVEKLVFMYK